MSESSCNQSNDIIGFDVLAAEVGISLPGVAEPIVTASIFRASVKFLSESRVNKDTIRLDYERFVDKYPIEVMDCNSILSIEEVRLDGQVISTSIDSNGWVVLPRCFTNQCDGTDFEVDVILGLSKDACELPKFIYERFGAGIINLTLSRLYGMFGEEWYDPNMVRFYGGIAQQSIKDAKTAIQLDETNGDIPIEGVRLIL